MLYDTSARGSALLLHAALVREEGKTFGVLLLNQNAFDQDDVRTKMILDAPSLSVFAGHPVVVAVQDEVTGRARCAGPRDLVNLVSRVSIEDLPWRTYRVSLP